jgi:hypothetical protein
MPVILDDELVHQFRSVWEYIDKRRTVGSLTAGFVRSCEQLVRRSPTATDDAHGDVIGPNRGSLKTRMAREAVCPEGEWEDARRAS